ncbi:hypothetical protein H257_15739 [Aphanomyces astaci]|uniref:Secreted protein n=1 Tax=Aphanomyces astaci TaxID=112090 RepID=W4FNM4_APHAT|nr:hypothetical protein H257_15739 [Aphanomyces astaci]ETV68293.1 hypothetical protein H257_15739 [Aphanomyces astaci]|eukprot:XP_009842236.1 hypothetical protein H257_15739 [Aphanomyces astaci]
MTITAALVAVPWTTIAAVCPYATLPSSFNSILVSDTALCPAANMTCVVDRACRLLGTPDTLSWNAIGNYSGLPASKTSWVFNGGQACTHVNVAVFPSTISSLKLSNMTFPPEPVKPSWPPKLNELFIEATNITVIPSAVDVDLAIPWWQLSR